MNKYTHQTTSKEKQSAIHEWSKEQSGGRYGACESCGRTTSLRFRPEDATDVCRPCWLGPDLHSPFSDMEKAYMIASQAADKFREALCEVLELTDRPSDDELISQLKIRWQQHRIY